MEVEAPRAVELTALLHPALAQPAEAPGRAVGCYTRPLPRRVGSQANGGDGLARSPAGPRATCGKSRRGDAGRHRWRARAERSLPLPCGGGSSPRSTLDGQCSSTTRERGAHCPRPAGLGSAARGTRRRDGLDRRCQGSVERSQSGGCPRISGGRAEGAVQTVPIDGGPLADWLREQVTGQRRLRDPEGPLFREPRRADRRLVVGGRAAANLGGRLQEGGGGGRLAQRGHQALDRDPAEGAGCR